MLHEVLFGLLGHGLFIQTAAKEHISSSGRRPSVSSVASLDENGGLSSSNTTSRHLVAAQAMTGKVPAFMVPQVMSIAEASLVEELMQVGLDYKRLEGFVERHLTHDGQDAALVLRALCRGVQELMNWHHECVVSIEALALQEAHLPLSRVKYLVMDSKSTFQVVVDLCNEIEISRIGGGQIINTLYKAWTRCAIPAVKEQLARLLHRCNQVFFNMIETWMVHGILLDKAREFFLEERPYNVVVPNDDSSGSIGANPSRGQEHHPLIAEYEWKSQFGIRGHMLPDAFLDQDLANKILFVGKAVRVLRRSEHLKTQQSSHHLVDPAQESEASEFQLVLDHVKQSTKFDVIKLTQAIRKYYFSVAFRLQELVVKDARLVDNLKFIRDMFLLGKGELYTSFISLGHDLLSQSPRPTLSQAEAAVNAGPWCEAAAQSGLDTWPPFESKAFENLRLVLSRSKLDFRGGFGGTSGTSPSAHDSLRVPRTSGGGANERSKPSELVLVGNAQIRENIISIQGPRGGVWSGSKLQLERGFSSRVVLSQGSTSSSEAGSEEETIVSFCIQNDTLVGPTALGELRNGMNFSAIFSPAFDRVKLQVDKQGEVLTKIEHGLLNDEHGHYTLCVDYVLEGENRVKMMVHMQVVDTKQQVLAELKEPLEVTKSVQLERGSGRAWVGMQVATPVDRQIRIGAWHFVTELAAEKTDEFDPWRALLTLQMHVDWPLHLVLTQSALDQYGMMFRFLLCLKRVEAALKGSWAILNQTRFKRAARDSAKAKRLMLLWRLRSSMAYLVNNLQFHLQADVIDSLESALETDINNARDFAVVENAHEKFLESLIVRSFLHNKVIRNTIDTVLRRCLRFSSLVEKFARLESVSSSQPENMNEIDEAFRELARSFTRDATFLYALLARMNSNLLLRVDYNGHFSDLAKKTISYV